LSKVVSRWTVEAACSCSVVGVPNIRTQLQQTLRSAAATVLLCSDMAAAVETSDAHNRWSTTHSTTPL
jgi:hypothetical protein